MNIFEVSYVNNYSGETKPEVEQITESRLGELVEYAKANPDKYSDIKVLRNLGEEDCGLIPIWLQIGRKNPWIKESNDPPFNEQSFCECKTIEYLIEMFARGNWSLGSAFYYKNLCFINQVDGGDEWLTVRGNIDFESVSCGYIISRDGAAVMKELIERFLAASDEQLISLEY